MIEIPIDVRSEHLDKVKNFCKLNNVTWGRVYAECLLDGASGRPDDVQKVIDFNEKLEKDYKKYRKSKSFWWRLNN